MPTTWSLTPLGKRFNERGARGKITAIAASAELHRAGNSKKRKTGPNKNPRENPRIEPMKKLAFRFPGDWKVLVASTVAFGLAAPVHCQEAAATARTERGIDAAAGHSSGVAFDWSHRHLIFSDPGTAGDAQLNGVYDRWLRIAGDPRYAVQQMRRGGAGPGLSGAHSAVTDEQFALQRETTSEDENPVETDAAAADLPAFRLPRGLTPARIQPPAPEAELAPVPSRPEFHAPVFRPKLRRKPNLFEKDWSENMGSGGTVGMGNSPATFTNTSASCSADFAIYNTSLPGSLSQASIVAFYDLYSSCSPRPSVDWAFDTGGTIQTSVALSLDGAQVAFVQTDNSTGDADFVVLKWAAGGSLTSPTPLTSVSSASAYPGCSAPCMYVMHFAGNPTDTNSSPYIDYATGNAYVGDDAGAIHKFTNIFTAGNPGEAGSGWPITLNTSTDAALGSPVYDGGSGNVFVGDYLANMDSSCEPGIETPEGQCGYLYSVDASSRSVTQSPQLDYNLGIYDGPIVDSSAGEVYAFVGADSSTNCSSGPCAAVFQFPVGFTSSTVPTEATVGPGYETLFSGAFDNQYFTSSGSPSGHLYVVGNTGPQNNTLYAITISGGAMTAGAATAGPQVATNYTTGSVYAPGLQVTEFCNNGSNACSATQGTDFVFLSVLAYGANPCPSPGSYPGKDNGCVMGFTAPLTSGSGSVVAANATPNGTLQEAGGTSGIVVDNGAAGASNIYFSTLLNSSLLGLTCGSSGGGGCAVSATQAKLQ